MSAAARVRSLALKKSGLQARLACQMVSDFGRGGKRGGEGERWGGGESASEERDFFSYSGALLKSVPSFRLFHGLPLLRFYVFARLCLIRLYSSPSSP